RRRGAAAPLADRRAEGAGVRLREPPRGHAAEHQADLPERLQVASAAGRVSTLLSAHGVRKSFGGVEVLHGVDLDAASGSILALLGENGAGKSTLVKILAGDYVPDAGEIEIGGERFSHLTPISARAAGVRMIHQEFQDAPTLSVAENISLGRLPARR